MQYDKQIAGMHAMNEDDNQHVIYTWKYGKTDQIPIGALRQIAHDKTLGLEAVGLFIVVHLGLPMSFDDMSNRSNSDIYELVDELQSHGLLPTDDMIEMIEESDTL